MLNQIIIINRKKYAVGLLWQPIGVGFVPRSYARNLAKNVDKKLNLFTEYRSMVALGGRKFGQRSGMPSAAAEVIDALTEYNSFLSVFRVDKLFYLVAVRNGVILEDKVFDSEDKARKEYSELSEIPDWTALIAPESWAMPRAVERNLSDLITGSAHALLRPISRFSGGFWSLILIILFGVVALNLFREPINQIVDTGKNQIRADTELMAEYKKQVEEKNKELDEKFEIERKAALKPLVLPYNSLPDKYERAELCYRAIGFLMQPIPGWVQVRSDCSENDATVEFRRTFGTLGDFYNIATKLMPGVLVTEQSEDVLIVRADLPKLKTYASLDERDADTVLRDVMTAFQAIDTPADTEIFSDTLTNGQETAVINTVNIAAKTKLVPMQFMQTFDDFEGVYMTRCDWNAAQRIWNYEVIIYAK